MASEAAGRVVAWLAEAARRGHEPLSNTLLCRTACRRLDVAGVSVTLMSQPHDHDGAAAGALLQEPVAASDRPSALLEELQLTTGEGPSTAAFAQAGPVLIPDLHAVTSRWPGFVPAALDQEVAGVFAFPLLSAVEPVGVLTVHRAMPTGLDPQTCMDARVFAELAVELLHTDPTGPLTAETRPEDGPAAERDEVHQAVGMLAVQLGVSLSEAFTRLRTHAFSHDLPLSELARQVLTGQMHLPADAAGES